MRYAISYDLVAPGRNYQPLWDALGALGAVRILQSQWAVRRYDTSAVGIRDHVSQFMDRNDRLMVTCLDGTDWAGRNLMADLNGI